MNKNTFMSPLRGLALASVAVAALSSCAKDEFTEQNALGLELQRLRSQRQIDSLARAQQRIYDVNSLRYQRSLDSLDRINAGGRVFYSVAVVSGSSTAFSTGRSEEAEGVAGATVSVSQYGAVVTVTTPASGLATAEMRSGAAVVVISAPNHTTLNYVVNLTPDGSTQIGTGSGVNRNNPGNGTTVYVSNVMPLFQTGGANAATAMGTIRGLALIETNLTNDVPEAVSPAILGTGTNLMTANIDVNAAFMTRYINNRLNNSAIPSIGAGWEGDVQKVAYESATSVATLDATGNYSVLVPATASGLPIRLKYSDIATNRTWYAARFDGIDHNAVITRRFNYGPNATPTPGIIVGNMPGQVNLTQRLSVVTTEATGTVTVNTPGNLTSEVFNGVRYFVFNAAAMGAARYIPGTPGAYLANGTTGATVPTVTFAAAPAGGTTATGTVELSAPNAITNLRTVVGVRVTAAGAGYTGGTAATFTDGFNVTGVTGTGTLQAPIDQLGSVQVIDGGFGFRSTGAAPYGTPNQWTERAPTILFSGQATLTAPKITPGVNYVRDGAIAGFVNGVSNVGTTLGTIQRINVTAPGASITPADLATITFDYGSGAVVPANDGAGNGGDALFVTSAGALEYNPLYGTGTTAAVLDLVASVGTAAGMSRGARAYVFVPSASLTGQTVGGGATFAVQVDATGFISQVRIATPGSAFTNAGVSAATVVISTPSNSLSARAFLRGTGIDNYVYDIATLGTASIVTTFNSQARQPLAALPPFGGNADQNNYIAVFDAPAAGGVQAEGIPVFDAQNRIVGLEITNPGVGYAAPVRFRIVAAGAAPATAFRQAGNAAGSVGIVGRSISIATVGGTGYSLAPQVFFTGGGRLLADQSNSQLFPGDFNIVINPATGDLTSIAYTGPFYWDVAALAADPIRVIISSENNRINLERAYAAFLGQASAAAAAGIIYAVPGPNGSIRAIQMVRASSTFPGDIEAYLNGQVTTLDTVEWYTRTLPVPYFNTTSFIIAPRITFQGTGATPGTGLTGAFVLAGASTGAPAAGAPVAGGGTAGGRIRNLRIITGGSGYVSGPITFNSRTVGRATDINTNIFAFVGAYTINYFTIRSSPNFYAQLRTGVPFTAIGIGVENGGLFNVEAFSGITYVRDIHYGTGQYVDN